jgi:hypothetical protein
MTNQSCLISKKAAPGIGSPPYIPHRPPAKHERSGSLCEKHPKCQALEAEFSICF